VLTVLPVCEKDARLLKTLLVWIRQLGGCKGHQAVIVADAATPCDKVLDLQNEASKSFDSVEIISTAVSVDGWPAGPNTLFLEAAQFAEKAGVPWLWLEPDCTPLVTGWLDSLEVAYRITGSPYLGSLVFCEKPGMPPVSLAGVAIYPPEANCDMGFTISHNKGVAFDISTACVTVKKAKNSPVFQHLWGEAKRPPTFAYRSITGTEVFSLQYIRDDAVLFHRCKDSSLIRMLRWMVKMEDPETEKIAVMLPFCSKDEKLMQDTLAWMVELHGRLPRTCVLHYDSSVNGDILKNIMRYAGQAFVTVLVSRYPPPRAPHIGWPCACNYAFRMACDFMEWHWSGPWLFFEPDAVAIHPDWFFQIEREYFMGGKPFMGIVIGEFDGIKMGHINGTAVYPANVKTYIHEALANWKAAWDVAMQPVTCKLTHPGNRIMTHCGAVVGGCCKWGNGPPNNFPDQKTVDQLIKPEIVFFHPSKNGSLIGRLRERKRK